MTVERDVSPATEAGRALVDLMGGKGWPATVRGIDRDQFADFLVRIEQEAAALERRKTVLLRSRANPDEARRVPDTLGPDRAVVALRLGAGSRDFYSTYIRLWRMIRIGLNRHIARPPC